jgi:hypothetical protein
MGKVAIPIEASLMPGAIAAAAIQIDSSGDLKLGLTFRKQTPSVISDRQSFGRWVFC